MHVNIEHILLQALMVLFPMVLYIALFNDQANKNKRKLIFTLILMITTGLVQIFAIKIDEGVILDLRMIPVYFAYMYGGNMAGLTVTFFIFSRLLLADGMIHPLSCSSL